MQKAEPAVPKLQPNITENTATFHLKFVRNPLDCDARKTANIPVLPPEAEMTRKSREKDEANHNTSIPCTAIMANRLPSLSVSLALLLYLRKVASPEVPTAAGFVSHLRDRRSQFIQYYVRVVVFNKYDLNRCVF